MRSSKCTAERNTEIEQEGGLAHCPPFRCHSHRVFFMLMSSQSFWSTCTTSRHHNTTQRARHGPSHSVFQDLQLSFSLHNTKLVKNSQGLKRGMQYIQRPDICGSCKTLLSRHSTMTNSGSSNLFSLSRPINLTA